MLGGAGQPDSPQVSGAAVTPIVAIGWCAWTTKVSTGARDGANDVNPSSPHPAGPPTLMIIAGNGSAEDATAAVVVATRSPSIS